eukprot:scaffold1415_cov152-Skeletonema_menzelii.AAC.6
MPFSSVLRSSDLHLSTSGICDSTVPGANGRLYYIVQEYPVDWESESTRVPQGSMHFCTIH